MNYKPHYSVHQKAHIALTPEISHQKHVVLVPFNYKNALMDSGGLRWGEMVNLRLEDGESGWIFKVQKSIGRCYWGWWMRLFLAKLVVYVE
jgi:hypothetical protein